MSQSISSDKKLRNVIISNPIFVSFIIFFLCLTSTLLVYFYNTSLQKKLGDDLVDELKTRIKNNLDASLRSSNNALLTLALTINDDGEPKDFNGVAKRILANNPDVDVLELVPGGVIKYIYPLAGNEDAMDYDILADPNRNQEAHLAIKQRSVYYAGPLDLKQGGRAVVGRLPIYIDSSFWGFSACLIHLETLFASAGIEEVDSQKFFVQLSKVNPSTGLEEDFIPNGGRSIDLDGETITFPQGDWKLKVMYNQPSSRKLFNWLILFLGLCFSFGTSILTYKILVRSREEISTMYRRLSAHLENSPLGIVEYNSDLVITKWNKRSTEIFGWTEEEVLSAKMGAFNIIHPDDMDKTTKVAEELLDGSVNGNVSHNKNYAKNGDLVHCIWYNSVLKNRKGEVISIMSLVQDVTKEKLAEIERHKAFARLDLIFNSTSDWMTLLRVGDDQKFYYELVNDRYVEGAGVKRESVVGQEVEDASSFNNWSKKAVETCGPVTYEHRFNGKDSEVVLEVTLTPIFNKYGHCINLLCVSRDITVKKETESELIRTHELTKEQNGRLMNFSYIVSHNLRSHTSNISGIVNMLEEQLKKDANKKLLDYLKTVSSSLDETMYHLNDVVNIQTNRKIQLSDISLSAEIDRTLELLAEKISVEKASVENSVSADIVLPFNSSYMESVLFNFLDNALKYKSSERSPVISLRTYDDDRYIVLEIADNGIGIDMKKHKNQLFGMFKRFHLEKDGKGIGLFITKNQIEALAGKVEVESTLGVGTTFKIYFQKEMPKAWAN